MHSMTRNLRAALAAAALALAGCSATHVGESWQCPIAQGASCASIADADPAVPETDDAPEGAIAAGAPLYRTRDGGESPMRAPERAMGPSCERGCGPLGWFARLLGLANGDAGRPDTRHESSDGAAAGPAHDRALAEDDAGAGSPIGAAQHADKIPSDAMRDAFAAAVPPVEAAANVSASALPAPASPGDGALREPEVIGRIWIAPFVDADGVYREAAWVRVVLEPAGWRLP